MASPFYIFKHDLFPRLAVWNVLNSVLVICSFWTVMMAVSTEQELGKKCNFGTLEKIAPLHHACLFCMCRNIESWSNLPVSSWMRLGCHYWKVLPPRNGYTFATQAIWKTHFGQSWITTLKSLAPKEECGESGGRGGGKQDIVTSSMASIPDCDSYFQ